MSANLGELTVRFTGDASELATTISEVQGQLSGLQAKSGGATAAIEGFIKNTKRGSDILSQYKAQMSAAGKAVDEHKTALAKAKTAVETNNSALTVAQQKYEATKKSVFDNCAALKQEQKQLSVLSQAKKNEISALEKANASINKNSLAYKDNEKAIHWTKNELSAIEKQQLNVQNALNSQGQALRSSIVDYNNAGAAVRNANKGYEQAETALKSAQSTYREYQDGLAAVEKQQRALNLQTTGKSLKDFGEGVDTVTKPLQVASAALAAGGVACAKFAIDFEDNFANVKKTVEGTPEQLAEIKQGIIDLTTVGIDGRSALPQTTAQLTEIAAAGGQLGIATENIVEFTETMAQMGTATNLSGKAGAATLARFMNVTNTSQDQVKNLGSAIVDLGNNFATTESEIAELGLRMGATGNVVGISAQDVLAYSTALSSMGIEAEAGGSSVSRIWMDIQSAVSAGGDDLAMFAEISGETSKEFADYWKKDASGAFQAFLKGLSKSEDQIAVLGDLGFNNIRDIQALQRLASDKGIDLLTDALKRSNTAWAENIALQREADAKAETTAGQLQITKNNLIEAGRSMGEAFLPMIKDASGKVAEFAQSIAQMSDEDKERIIDIAKNIVILGAGAKGVSAAAKGIGGFVEALGKIGAAAPRLASAAAAAGPAILATGGAIALTAGAVWAGTKAYEAYQKEQLNTVKVSDEQIKAAQDTLSEYEKISDWHKEAERLNTIITTSTDTTEVEQAKSALDELKKQVGEKYDLELTVNGGDINETLKQLREMKKIDLITERSRTQADLNYSDFSAAVENQKNKTAEESQAAERQQELVAAQGEIKNAVAAYKETLSEIDSLDHNSEEYIQRFAEASETEKKTLQKIVDDFNLDSDWDTAALDIDYDVEEATKKSENIKKEVEECTTEVDQFKSAIESVANDTAALIPQQLADGEYSEAMSGLKTALENISKYTKELGFDDFAQNLVQELSVAQQGFDNITQVAQSGQEGIADFLNDFASNSTAAGASAEDLANAVAQIGTSLINNGADADVINEIVKSIVGLPEDVTIQLNAEGTALEIIKNTSEETDKLDGKTATVKTEADTSGTDEAKEAIDGVKDKTVTISLEATIKAREVRGLGSGLKPNFAEGTNDAPGGLAVINDQRGVSDPRELVQIGDKGYLFEGRDVVLPIPEHAKVYTAAETQAILGNLPHYASGKNQTSGWEAAQTNREHYRKTTYSIISAADELEWLKQMRSEFAADSEAIREIEEQTVTYTKKMWQEQLSDLKYALDMGQMSQEEYYNALAAYKSANFAPDTEEYKDTALELHKLAKQILSDANDISSSWTDVRGALNDWDEIGDSMGAAYNRIQKRNLQAAQSGIITWDEYFDTLNENAEQLVNNYIDYSDNWIEHEKSYNAMSADENIAAIERQQQRINDFFASISELTEEQYIIKLDIDTSLADAKMDAYADKMAEWEDDADWYAKNVDVYGWDFMNKGDSETAFIQRKIDGYMKWSQDEHLSETERKYALRQADEMRLELYKATESSYDDMLDGIKAQMDEAEKLLSERLSALDEQWEVEDRAEDKAEAIDDINKYKNAVTIEGKEKYNEALDRLKEIEREEARYALEQENNAVIEQLQADYEALEAEKKQVLEQTAEANMQVASILQPLDMNLKSMESALTGKIDQVISVLQTQIERLKPNVTINQTNNSIVNDAADGIIFGNSVFDKVVDALSG